MTYLAPRQGLFAVIVLISFCLQTLLLVISTNQQLTNNRVQKGEQMVTQLIDEARLSLENKDRVSLSVIANRYASEQDIARLVIKDNNDEILVPVGNAPMQQGDTISQIATNGDTVIGSVSLTLKDISNGEIIAMQWPFVTGSLFLHLLLWLLYGYIARPTKEQLNTLSRDIENVHRASYPQTSMRRPPMNGEAYDENAAVSPNTLSAPKVPIDTASIHSEVNAYLKSQQTVSDTDDTEPTHNTSTGDGQEYSDSSMDNRLDGQVEENSSTSHDPIDPDKASDRIKPSTQAVILSATRPFDSVSVQIVFYDDYNMLERLAPETRTPYLALCTQLLRQALSELLKQSVVLGVSAVNEPYFDEQGACVVLKAGNSYAKVALAGVMLGKLYLMLNKIIHDKHIELERFALPVTIGVSDKASTEAMGSLLKKVGKKEQMYILLPYAGLKQIGNYVQVQSLSRPTTVYERECAVFDGGSDAIMQRLAQVRNAVLMTENAE